MWGGKYPPLLGARWDSQKMALEGAEIPGRLGALKGMGLEKLTPGLCPSLDAAPDWSPDP